MIALRILAVLYLSARALSALPLVAALVFIGLVAALILRTD